MALVRRNDRWPTVPALFGNVWGADPFEFLGRGHHAERAGQPLATFLPPVEVKETAESYLVKADLPGTKMEDVKVTLTGNVLRIEGQRHAEKRDEKDRMHVTERSYGSFARAFALPEGTDVDHVVADMIDGVLTVTIPKRQEEKPRQIKIGGAASNS